MATLDDTVAAAEAALSALYDLQSRAMTAGDTGAQQALGDRIADLTDKLGQLRAQQIAGDDARLDALNAQLDAVTTSAQASLDDIRQVAGVVSDVLTAAKMVDGVVKAVAGV